MPGCRIGSPERANPGRRCDVLRAGRLQRCEVRTCYLTDPPAPRVLQCSSSASPRVSSRLSEVAAAAWLSLLLRLSLSRTYPDSFGFLFPVLASNLLIL